MKNVNKNNNNNLKMKTQKFKKNKLKTQPYHKDFRNSNSNGQHTERKNCLNNLDEKLYSESEVSFQSLQRLVSKETMSVIVGMGFKTMTEIQAKTITKLLKGNDLLATAKTGTGKTLAFLIPIVELITKLRFSPEKGTGAIIISPTRELSMQTFGVLKSLMKHHSQSIDLVIGGTKMKTEAYRLSQGVNILVATPGRLLDHLEHSPEFLYKNLKALVIDEGDQLLQIGFEYTMKKIIGFLPKKRQTMWFSATHDAGTKDLAETILSSQFAEVHVDVNEPQATVASLNQVYVVCPMERKLLHLYSFIGRNRDKKGMVFFNYRNEVKLFALLFRSLDISVKNIHGRLGQNQRTSAFNEFKDAERGVLFCTDVAGRGWDIPSVDWIIQFDPPADLKEYIHRVGRTARAGKDGYAILYLREEERNYIDKMKEQKVDVGEMKLALKDVKEFPKTLKTQLLSNEKLLLLVKKKRFRMLLKSYHLAHYFPSPGNKTKIVSLCPLASSLTVAEDNLVYSKDDQGIKSKKKKKGNKRRKTQVVTKTG